MSASPAPLVLLLDKPTGIGSTDVVREVRHAFRTERVGHTGTLDPDASGLLVVCVGDATKLVPFLTAEDKVYEATLAFGAATDTDDATGAVVANGPTDHLDRAAIADALAASVGPQLQLPPRYSAIRVQGRRLHERVRAGENVDALLTPREVVLHAAELVDFTRGEGSVPGVREGAEAQAAPAHSTAAPPVRATVRLHVGKGYYVRSLARDLGERLGTRAHLIALRRTRVGRESTGFHVDEAASLDSLGAPEGQPVSGTLDPLIALRRVMPSLSLTPAQAQRVRTGQRIGAFEFPLAPTECPLVATLDSGTGQEELVAVAEIRNGRLEILRGF